jgi:hypothetical protein
MVPHFHSHHSSGLELPVSVNARHYVSVDVYQAKLVAAADLSWKEFGEIFGYSAIDLEKKKTGHKVDEGLFGWTKSVWRRLVPLVLVLAEVILAAAVVGDQK